MQVTKHFTMAELTRSDTATRHGIINMTEDPAILENIKRTAQMLEKIRDLVGRPVVCLSCYRSPIVNRLVGGSKNSAHMQGLAADIRVPNMSNRKLADTIAQHITCDQIILEFPPEGWVHVGLSNKQPRHQLLTAIKRGGKTVYEVGIIDVA